MLAQEGARLRARADLQPADPRAGAGGAAAPVEEEEEDEEDEEDEELQEDLGFISPLENIDSYVTFKHALQGECLYPARL